MQELSFEAPNHLLFPCLDLAWQVLNASGCAAVVLNAANEVAVEAFLQRRIGFKDIYRINSDTLEVFAGTHPTVNGLDDLLELDQRFRAEASRRVGKIEGTVLTN
jgi:1-deoxy-D-xylulose-5-phosphate reductoisomerase